VKYSQKKFGPIAVSDSILLLGDQASGNGRSVSSRAFRSLKGTTWRFVGTEVEYAVMSSSLNPREPCGLSYAQLGELRDDQLMTHLAAGHGDALAVLLDRFGHLVHRIAYRILHDSSEAEDLAQEVFLELCRTAVRFDAAKGSTKMWVARTAYRRSLNRRRYLNLRQADAIDDREELPDPASATEGWISPKLTPYESQRLIRQMLRRLDPLQRRVLELVFFDGLTMREVAAKTGTSLESVRHRYYRGIDKLRRVMQEGFARKALPRGQEIPDAGT